MLDDAIAVGHQGALRNVDAQRCARAARRVLQIAALVGAEGPRYRAAGGKIEELRSAAKEAQVQSLGCLAQISNKLVRRHRRNRAAAFDLPPQSGDVCLLTAERCW